MAAGACSWLHYCCLGELFVFAFWGGGAGVGVGGEGGGSVCVIGGGLFYGCWGLQLASLLLSR
jgi:hypothetical protein